MQATRANPLPIAVLIALGALSTTALAQSLPPAPSGVRAPVQTDRPLNPAGTRGSTPTQTEDDVYVGIKRSAGDTRTPAAAGTTKPLTPQGPLVAQPATSGVAKPLTPPGPLVAPGVAPRPGAVTSPNTGTVAAGAMATKNARGSGGSDGDLDELEVERRKVQGVNAPTFGAPPPRPSADTAMKMRSPGK